MTAVTGPATPQFPADSFFGMLPPQVRQRMQQHGRAQVLKSGEHLHVDENSVPPLVMRGIALVEQGEADHPTTFSYVGPGDLATEQHTLGLSGTGLPVLPVLRMTFKTRGHVLRFGRDDFASIMGMSPACTAALAASVLVKYQRELWHRSLFAEKVPTRLYRMLWQLGRRFGTVDRFTEARKGIELINIDLDVTNQDLAKLIGASDSSVTDVLKLLREKGWIRTRYRHFTLVRDRLGSDPWSI